MTSLLSISIFENFLPHLSILYIGLPFLVFITHLIPYLADPYCIRSNGITGPLLARVSDAWLGWVAVNGHRSEVVHELHKKYGTFVRLAPNHVSINHPSALQTIYAHGNGTLKSNFYDAFVSITRGLFNTRSRTEHTRKRKIVSHIFSQKSVLEFEPHIRLHVGELFAKWDGMYEEGLKGGRGEEGEGWVGRGGRVWFDCLPWYNYLAFDIIGDLAFGSPFGMISKGKDSAPVASNHKAAMSSYSTSTCASKSTSASTSTSGCTSTSTSTSTTLLPAVQILNDRGEFSASLGVLPPAWRPIVRRCVPWFAKGDVAVKRLAGLAIAAVSKRLTEQTDRVDLLSKLQEGKDDEGRPMGREELTAEAQTQLIAGSDTTSNSTCAITYYVARNPSVQSKLQKELDSALTDSDSDSDSDSPVAFYEEIKKLPYLEAVINESLRIHSTSGIGLPRVVPPSASGGGRGGDGLSGLKGGGKGGLTVLGKTFPEGTVLSVPTYSLHRDEEVWGEDADVFRPERWLEGDASGLGRGFNPFSYGPRACVGRNLANMELLIIVASLFRRYHFVLEDPDKELETREGFLRKPVGCRVGVKLREI